MNRERLFSRLGPTLYAALVEATQVSRERRHAFVDLDHWLTALLRRPDSDMVRLLQALDVDLAAFRQRLEQGMAKTRESGDAVRDLSPVLEQCVGPAVTWSQILLPAGKVRSGHLLMAWLEQPAIARWFTQHDAKRLVHLDQDELIAAYEDAGAHWPEAAECRLEGGPSHPAGAEEADGDALAKWATCMTELAAQGQLDPVVGRHQELRQVIDILLRRRQNNPILVGEAGVGKTAIVEALAQEIHAGRIPPALHGAQVWALDITRMQAGASARGEFEQRLRSVMDAVTHSAVPVILFCDEAHTLVGAGGQAGTGDAVNLIKPMLARGQLRMVAATTWAEYKQFIEPDAALTRRFQTVPVDEPSDEGALGMLRVIAPRFAEHHGVHISDAALSAAVTLSRRYLPARQLPDKAIALLDTACARVAMSQCGVPADLDQLRHTVQMHEQALAWHAIDERLGLAEQAQATSGEPLVEAREQLQAVQQAVRQECAQVKDWLGEFATSDLPKPLDAAGLQWVQPWVDAGTIAQVLSEWSGIPCAQIDQDDASRLVTLSEQLCSQVHGQDAALAAIAQTLQVSRAGLQDPQRPLGVLLLAGPTGTGKSQTAAVLAELLFGGRHQLVQFNMNEFQEAHTVSTLKGAPPGYVGFGKGGRLTEAVRKRPYCVLLLDEFDRAHRDVQDIFYQAFDQGWMEDGEGRRVSFRNCLILLTTNVGDAEIATALAATPDMSQARLDAVALQRLQRQFAPALLSRIQVMAFRPLTQQALEGVARQGFREVGDRLEAQGLRWWQDPRAAAWVAQAVAQHPSAGRAVRDLLRQVVMPQIASSLLKAQSEQQTVRTVCLHADDGLAVSLSASAEDPVLPDTAAMADITQETTCA